MEACSDKSGANEAKGRWSRESRRCYKMMGFGG